LEDADGRKYFQFAASSSVFRLSAQGSQFAAPGDVMVPLNLTMGSLHAPCWN
jgi:hypothetical protein